MMDILIETTIIFSRNKKYQRGDLFRTDEKRVRRAALEWDYFVIQEQLKYLMYDDRSLRSDSIKDKFIDEINLNNCMSLRRKKTSKFFVGIT